MGYALAEIELMLQDENYGSTGADLTETKQLRLNDDVEDRFLDGPASRRIAIVDFDPVTGAPLGAPAPFTPYRAATPTRGRFKTSIEQRYSAPFIAVNAYGTVFETIRMFEEPGAMGRRVTWAFDGEQLLIVPRAGQWANAFYERATRSLQFFWFDAAATAGGQPQRIYTALSRDIVAHECGHALLDAVVPSLYDSSTVESLSIHEGIADLVAVLMALRSKTLRNEVLEKSNNDIANAKVFSSIAEQFGAARPRPDDPHPHALRDLSNNKTMETVDTGKAHELSTVLSAVFYDTLVDMFQKGLTSSQQQSAQSDAHAANRALGSAAIIFRRLVLRGIDYLPPGELTFADVARATLAADLAADIDKRKATARQRLSERFVARKIVASVDELTTHAPQELAIKPESLADIRDSDWAAYRYVEANRKTFGIPEGIPFRVLPRVDATKQIGVKSSNGTYATQRELLLKVAWEVLEDNHSPALPARRRIVRTGATCAYRWDDGKVLALVSSNVTDAEQNAARDQFAARLLSDARVRLVTADDVLTAAPQDAGVEVRILGDVARITGTQRLLHIQEF